MRNPTRPLFAASVLVFAFAVVGCGSASMSVGTPPPAGEPAPAPAPEPEAKKEEPIKAVGHLKVEADEIKVPGKIQFDNDKATLRSDKETTEILTEMVELLKENPGITKLRIEGYTDDKGKPDYNHKLSRARAEAVAQWLVSKGIDASRIEAVGYGEEYPKAANTTDDGREENRRVEFHVTQLKGEAFGQPRPEIKVVVNEGPEPKKGGAKAKK